MLVSVAAIESRETVMSKALKEAEDWHAHQLGEAYLVTRPSVGRWPLNSMIP